MKIINFFLLALSFHLMIFVLFIVFSKDPNLSIKNIVKLTFSESGDVIQNKQSALQDSKKIFSKKNNKLGRTSPTKRSKSATSQYSEVASSVLTETKDQIKNTIVYPALARRMLWQGRVKALVKISEDQKLSVTIEKSSGYKILDQEVIKALKNYKFKSDFREIEFYFNVHFKLK